MQPRSRRPFLPPRRHPRAGPRRLGPGRLPAPDASAGPGQSTEPKEPKEAKEPKAAKEAKADRGPELTTTVTGTVTKGMDDKGRPTYALTAGDTTWALSAGPPWFWGDANPLEASVGKRVTIAGTYHEGATDLDVQTVDGTAIRSAGKPPWAGGPKAVGERHPGWKGEGHPGKGHGQATAPGQRKQASPAP